MIALALLAAALAGEPKPSAAADDAKPVAEATAPAAKASDADPLVCKYEPVLGTRLSTRTCLPKSQREQMERRAREAVENIQTKSLGPWRER